MPTKVSQYIPWRLMHWLLRRQPRAYQFLTYGVSNVNTQEHWNEAWARHGEAGFRATAEIQEIRTEILKVVPRGASVLDVGCGVGEIMTLLRDANACKCSGVDIAPSAVAAVVSKGMHAERGALPAIPYADRSFDAIVCTETLEHVTDVQGSLQSIRRVLKPGGILVLSVPDGSVDEEDSHVHRFTQQKLSHLLKLHRFSLDSIDLIRTADVSPSLIVKARRPFEENNVPHSA